jgi:hypothetical protein
MTLLTPRQMILTLSNYISLYPSVSNPLPLSNSSLSISPSPYLPSLYLYLHDLYTFPIHHRNPVSEVAYCVNLLYGSVDDLADPSPDTLDPELTKRGLERVSGDMIDRASMTPVSHVDSGSSE